MDIIKAKVLGYCMGVRRAVETAENAVQTKTKNIYTLGPLIHNPTVLKNLEKKGCSILTQENLNTLTTPSTVIIRAHGTTPQILDKLKTLGHTVLDATCPRVHLSQKRASEWAKKGYTIIIAGDRNHGEVLSICGYAQGSCIVIENAQEAENLQVKQNSVLIAQTTFSPLEFEKITQILRVKNQHIIIFNTICTATLQRQNALCELKDKVDGILIVGGKSSANTRRLYETASSFCSKVALIEDSEEIPKEFYNLEKVGLTAGASTPDNVIDTVEQKLLEYKNNQL